MNAVPAGSRSRPLHRGRAQSLAPIVIFDMVGPLVGYLSVRAAGMSTVGALVVSGVLPMIGIALGFVRHRRLDAIGVLVLIGIIAGTALGLASRSADLVLLDGTVPTAVFGVVCVGSLWSKRPMIYRFALQATGADTPSGQAFADRWRYPGFHHAFRVTTMVWGVAFLAETAAQVVIIRAASTATAKTTSNLLPMAVGGVVVTWNIFYAKRGQRRGELAEQAARARGDAPPAMPT